MARVLPVAHDANGDASGSGAMLPSKLAPFPASVAPSAALASKADGGGADELVLHAADAASAPSTMGNASRAVRRIGES